MPKSEARSDDQSAFSWISFPEPASIQAVENVSDVEIPSDFGFRHSDFSHSTNQISTKHPACGDHSTLATLPYLSYFGIR